MSQTEIKTKIIKIDAAGKILGRLATEIADTLRGKNTPHFLPYKAPAIKVIIFNTNKIKFTGDKEEKKIYYRHSGYPGGIKEEKLKDVLARDSREVIRRAVYGMLPKNKLRDVFIRNLELRKEEYS